MCADGREIHSENLARAALEQGGAFALGQEQEKVCCTFEANPAFDRDIYGVRVYDNVCTPAEVADSAGKGSSRQVPMRIV